MLTIIKYSFWQMMARDPEKVYGCINYGEAVYPYGLRERGIYNDRDIGKAYVSHGTCPRDSGNGESVMTGISGRHT